MPAKSHRRAYFRSHASSRTIGLIAVFFNILFWGLAPAIIKSGLDVIPAEVFLYYRFLIVIALATPFLFFFKPVFASLKRPSQLLVLLGIGLLTNPLSLGMLFVGLSMTTSLAGAMLSSTAPLFIVISSAIFLKEKITRNELIGIAIATIGTVFIVLETPEQAHATNPVLGNTLILLQNILWTAGVLLMKKFAHKHHPFLFGYTGWLTGFVFFFFYTLWKYPAFIAAPLAITQIPEAFLPIVYMAVFGSLIAFTAYQVAQRHLLASEVSIFSYILPLVTIPLSIFWLHERLTPLFVFGGVLLAIGVIVAEFHSRSRLVHVLRKKRT
ncbi:MAG: hypothetical protein A2804_02910 [Candidatus Pacebacteria bacterium RIFCSPHIGHO2_01_FULL_46_10]|nr:MAG: hypothetical protein A2804_02910 [Candidatus Pacebacteria bacterium RIFCSPHIGHO2_01_FULL_46_10]